MRYSTLDGVDKQISRVVLGTMIINRGDKDKSFALLDAAQETGVTTLDTAHIYAGGDSERCIGEWMQARGNREQVVILTKGCHHNPDRKRVTPFDIRSDLHDSLARLQTDYVDMYLLHRDNTDVPTGPIVETLNALKDEGKIRTFGGSNWTHQRLQDANAYAEAHKLQPMTASSPHYSLAEQVENPWGHGCVGISGPTQAEARAFYKETGIAVFAYSSLARGLFSGRVKSDDPAGAAAVVDGACQKAYCHPDNFKRLARAEELAQEKGLSVPQIALAYVLNSDMNMHACVGAGNPAELKANVEVADVDLTPDERAWLDLRAETR